MIGNIYENLIIDFIKSFRKCYAQPYHVPLNNRLC